MLSVRGYCEYDLGASLWGQREHRRAGAECGREAKPNIPQSVPRDARPDLRRRIEFVSAGLLGSENSAVHSATPVSLACTLDDTGLSPNSFNDELSALDAQSGYSDMYDQMFADDPFNHGFEM